MNNDLILIFEQFRDESVGNPYRYQAFEKTIKIITQYSNEINESDLPKLRLLGIGQHNLDRIK